MKKSFYILGIVLLCAIIIILFFWLRGKESLDALDDIPVSLVNEEIISPIFMTDAEKIEHNLSTDSRVQILHRDDVDGLIMNYKIIRSDDDLITNRKDLRIRE